jgi:hypothetical protein
VFGYIGSNLGTNFNKMKELKKFREFLNENKKNELRSLIQDLTSFEYEAFANDVGVDVEDGAEMEEFIVSISDQQADSLIQSINFGKYGYMASKGFNEDKMKELNEATFSNQEIVAKVEEFINGPLTQLRKEVYDWYNSFDPDGPESDDEKAFYLREALSEANKGIKKALTGVKKLK